MIKINDEIEIDEGSIEEEFIRSSGPGGQNVNKVATAVSFRFNLQDCKNLSSEVIKRLIKIAGHKISRDEDGKAKYIIIKANRFRTQNKNREDAINRLKEMILRALKKPKKRFETKPSKASIEKRILKKKIIKEKKKMRKKIKNFTDES